MGALFRDVNGRSARGLLVLAVAGVLVLSLGAAIGPGAVVGDDDNVTPPHVHPDEQDEEGDLAALQAWLGDYLGAQLGESVIQVEEEQYDRARDLVGEEYLERFSDYASVNRETDDDGEEDAFQEARDRQEETIDLIEEFEEKKTAYEEAVAAGDEEEARRLARELVELAEEIDHSSEELLEFFASIDEDYADMTEPMMSIERVNENVSNESSAIAEAELEATTLSVSIDDPEIAFDDPLTGTGTIETEEGEPLADETVTIQIEGTHHTVETDANGAFELEHRPVTVPVGSQHLTVTFVPDDASPYRSSETDVTVTVSQTTGSVEIESSPETVAYAEDVAVAARVTVDGEPVEGLPMAVRIGNTELATANASAGEIAVSPLLPAAADSGERTLRIGHVDPDAAVVVEPAEVPVTVETTETNIDLDVEEDEGAIVVDGQLATADGLPVPEQTVTITVDGTETTVTTDESGSFDAAFAAPDAESATVTASFDGEGGNLESTETDRTVSLPVPAPPADEGPFGDRSTAALVVLGAAAVIVVLGAVAIRRDLRARLGALTGRRPAHTEPGATETSPEKATPTVDADEQGNETALLAHARGRLDAGDPDAAVIFGYAAVRDALGEAGDDALTHWEFFERHRHHDGEAGDAALRDVTAGFEVTVFADAHVEAPGTYLERVESLCAGRN